MEFTDTDGVLVANVQKWSSQGAFASALYDESFRQGITVNRAVKRCETGTESSIMMPLYSGGVEWSGLTKTLRQLLLQVRH